MQKNQGNILRGIVVSRFGDQGPEPIAWHPEHLDHTTLTSISIKSISILAGEDGALPSPENLSVLPLPRYRMSIVIYPFEIPDPKARGGAITVTVSVLFDEKYTSVIYKTMDGLVKLISPMDNLIEPLQKNEDITESVKEYFNQINEFIESCREDEITRYQIAPPAERRYAQKYSFKIIVVGDPRVGKTTLVLRFVDKAFRELYIPTVGVQVSLKNLEISEGTLVKFNIWDIAGQELFNKVRDKFFIGAQAVLIMYDVTNPKTFKDVKVWYMDMKKAVGEMPGFLVGNKVDLPRQISKLDGKELANQLNLDFVETSAKTGENVELVFKTLAEMLVIRD